MISPAISMLSTPNSTVPWAELTNKEIVDQSITFTNLASNVYNNYQKYFQKNKIFIIEIMFFPIFRTLFRILQLIGDLI